MKLLLAGVILIQPFLVSPSPIVHPVKVSRLEPIEISSFKPRRELEAPKPSIVKPKVVKHATKPVVRSGCGRYNKSAIAYTKSRVPASQWDSLYKLWEKESHWDKCADNPRSTAYGVPQLLDGTAKGHGCRAQEPDYTKQISCGLSYIKGRYGTPNNAWSHSVRVGWY